MVISDFFRLTETEAETYCWTLISFDPDKSPVDALAEALADRIVQQQCRGCLHHYEAWRNRANGGDPLTESTRQALAAFLKPLFGMPENPNGVHKDHLEGFIGEILWYFLYLENPTEEIIRAEPPGFKSTDPGGDALVIHRTIGNYLMFRLWEMKKFSPESDKSSSSVDTTVRRAFTQLNSNALEYLARYTVIGQEIGDEELAIFYGQLVELWIDASPQAAAGVSIATSMSYASEQCFVEFGEQFPRFVAPVRLRGMLTAVDDFSEFVRKVQKHIWKGL